MTVTFFGAQDEELPSGSAPQAGKAAALACLTHMGLPVPAGFTLPPELVSGPRAQLQAAAGQALQRLEQITGRHLDDAARPLFLALRPDTVPPLPGALQGLLNLGITDGTVGALAKAERRFAFESYHRLIMGFAFLVHGIDPHHFEEDSTGDRTAEQAVERGRGIFRQLSGEDFPQSAHAQFTTALEALVRNWNAPRTLARRHLRGGGDTDLAITVQRMVFGNADTQSAAGTLSTRDPATGVAKPAGAFLWRVQDMGAASFRPVLPIERLGEVSPDAAKALKALVPVVEQSFHDAEEVDFVVESGQLWLLGARPQKRDARAALRIAVDLAQAGIISREDAVARIDPMLLDRILHPTIDTDAARCVIAAGLPASPGAAWGEIVFSPDEAERLAAEGRRVILVRVETSPEDIHGMRAAVGILTARGGMTSHAAVVARGMGKPCVTGAGAIRLDERAGTMSAGGMTLKAGDVITLDGSAGQVLEGIASMSAPDLPEDFATLLGWADDIRRMRVRANADTPSDARTARAFGAEGIGLCRTEHMFFDAARIRAVREMILAEDEASRRAALEKLLDVQRGDFAEIFEAMEGLPVTIRLLDPPLHEFLPKSDADIEDIAAGMGTSPDRLRRRARELDEFNPMLGFRGCRLAIAFPEIVDMQARAIFEAAADVEKRHGFSPMIEVMVPLVATRRELDLVRERIDAAAAAVAEETGITLAYHVGTMIELPRAALRAGDIAQSAEFFSYGTNDLTQMAFGISRDDAGTFLGAYMQKGVLPADPFTSIDREGVGELIRMASERGRTVRPDLKLGVCGEHGGDPLSVGFFEEVGLDYVSCSPFRVPIARLAAAQSALRFRKRRKSRV